MTSRTVCVTGGAGFIGSHVAEALVARGHRVLIVDDLSSGRKENVPAGAQFHHLDIRSSEAADLVRDAGVEVLVHHAAQMDVRRSVADPVFDAQVNVEGTLRLLEAGRQGSLRQVVFASTGGAMYGEQDVFPADEDHPTRPLSPYGVAKLAAERYLYFFHAAYGLDVTCLRYANVYGPRQDPHGEAGVVAIFTGKMLRGESPTIFDDGELTRDYVFVEDVARANLAALETDLKNHPDPIFNVSTNRAVSVNELFAMLRDAMGSKVDAVYGPPRPGDVRHSVLDAGRALKVLGWKAAVDVPEGLRRTVEYFRKAAK